MNRLKLELRDIQKSFGNQSVLKGCSYTFEQGNIYGLLGRNGAGKTTLFNILYEEMKQDSGTFTLHIDGKERAVDPEDIGMVFTDNYLPEFLTGYEFVSFFLDLHKQENQLSVDEYLDIVSIDEESRHRIIKTYSSGMQSKLSLLTVIITQPKIILLDEPLTAVDVVSGIELKQLFMNLKSESIIILSTHMLQLAEDMCDELVLLKGGLLSSMEDFRSEEQFEKQIIQALSEESSAL
ncbi:ABC transporter ATP-binding protein [Amphibacillus indicireducens]|uniref:ABC transporter ATP-binding protein n=1 Tax=Amphibacillus indicireducens TaxID=1076330 RepID=A0ABP7W2Z5_9BACI